MRCCGRRESRNLIVTETNSQPDLQPSTDLPHWLVVILAASVGVIAANLYYAQPLVALISKSIGLAPEVAGLVVTLTQVGYGLGVLCLVPLGDILESRKLILVLIGVAILGILGLGFVTSAVPYFLCAFATGVGSAGVQVIVPYAAHFSSEENRGRVIGSVTSGLMMGIMLSRPVASFLSDLFSWHAVFILSAVMMIAIGAMLLALMPKKEPTTKDLHYFSLLRSMLSLLATQPLLIRRAFYQACLFGAFCFYWTATPLLLGGSDFKLSQSMIAVFALVGFAGAIVAPFAGRAADRGLIPQATLASIAGVAGAFVITQFFPLGSTASLIMLGVGAIILDAGTSANLILGQRSIFALGAAYRSRLNALYISTIFIGGGIGSAIGAWAYAHGGWPFASWVGLCLPAAALAVFLTEKRRR
jgi:predicted MFS family arabinose efflux permease